MNLPFETDPTRRYLYRLIPEAFALCPHYPTTSTSAYKPLPSYFLGLNDDIYPTAPPLRL